MHATFRTIALTTVFLAAGRASAQAVAAAALRVTPTVFGGVSATETGVNSGRNLGFTAGVDMEIPRKGILRPALEYRGTLAIDQGAVDSQKDQLGGVRLGLHLPRFEPYVTALAGRGEIQYLVPLQVPGTPVFYTKSSSNVFAFGGGADLRLSSHFSVKADLQSQHYDTPVAASGHIFATTAILGIAYRVHFGLRKR